MRAPSGLTHPEGERDDLEFLRRPLPQLVVVVGKLFIYFIGSSVGLSCDTDFECGAARVQPLTTGGSFLITSPYPFICLWTFAVSMSCYLGMVRWAVNTAGGPHVSF